MMSNTLLIQAVCIGAGGFAGAVCRYLLSSAIAARLPGGSLAYGTLAVNGLGSLLLGFLWGREITGLWLLLMATGFLGAFTTFSTLKLEAEALLSEQRPVQAWVYMGLTYTLGLLLAAAGYGLGSS